jgi:hypothetical protein
MDVFDDSELVKRSILEGGDNDDTDLVVPDIEHPTSRRRILPSSHFNRC